MSGGAPAADVALRSDAIAIARVICILGMIYVHAWTGLTGEALAAQAGSAQNLLRWTLMEGLGKSAVPLLGMISGWLVQGSTRTRDWRSHIAAKGRTIFLPMLLWNELAIMLISGAAWLGWIKAPLPVSFDWLVEELTALTRPQDINVQMPFLRDLFVCMLLAPGLVRMSTKPLVALVIATSVVAIGGWSQPLLLRPIILVFFMCGMIARRLGVAEGVARRPFWQAVVPFALLLPFKVALSLSPALWEREGHLMAAFDLIMRMAAALFFWRLAYSIASSRAAGRFLALERYAFFLFCSHLILIWLLGPLLGEIFGPLGSPLYPIFLIAQPIIWLGIAILLAKLLLRLSPPFALILSGGRLR